MIKEINTACPWNCYSGCSFKVVVENDKIRSVEPQPLNKATSEGPCLKGLSHIERQYSPDRIIHPLRKQNGKFTRRTWDEAIEEIGNKLLKYKKDFGSHSVFFYSASGMAGLLNGISSGFWKLYGGVTTSYGDLCWPAGLEATRITLGDIKHNAPWDLQFSKLIIIWGKNPAESNIHQVVFIEKARLAGAKIVIIDPRRTPSTEFADLHIQPKPGTDGLLALALAKLVISNGYIDDEFIKNNVLGFSEFEKSLHNVDITETVETCGIPEEFIDELANDIGKIKPMTIIPGYGMQRYSNGGQTMRCILALQIITGNIGKKGATWHYANLQSYVFDNLKEPLSLYPDITADGITRRTIPTARLGKALLETIDPEIKMAWIERGNPLAQNPDSRSTIAALRKMEFVVVVDQFLTDTAQEADIILPAKTMFEQTDILGSYWNPYVRLRQKIVEPPGEVKPESEIYYLLGKQLGFDDSKLREIMPLPGDSNTEAWLEDYCKQFDNLSLKELSKGPIPAPGYEDIAYADLRFNTPSGKIELLSSQAKDRWDEDPLPKYISLIEKGDPNNRYPLHLLSPVTKNRIHSQFGNLMSISSMHPEPYIVISKIDADKRNITDGKLVSIYNDRGELSVKAKIDYSIRPGVVSLYNGYWVNEGACPNILSDGRETDMGHGAAFHDNCVEIEIANEK